MNDTEKQDLAFFLLLTTKIVNSYVANNAIPAGELTNLIKNVYCAVSKPSSGHQTEARPPIIARSAVFKKHSVQPDYLICLEDGKKFRTLKRHLAAYHGLTPDEYRMKWNLPPDYPMTAPNYAETRSALAKKAGLGTNRAARKQTVDVSTNERQNVKKRVRR